MRKTLTTTLIITSLLACPGVALSAPGWTSYGTVEEVYANSGGTLYVRLTITSNPTTCTDREWFSNSGSGAGAARVFATLLAAHATGKPLRIFATGTCDGNGYSELSSVSMNQ